jgi:hypothetical protein
MFGSLTGKATRAMGTPLSQKESVIFKCLNALYCRTEKAMPLVISVGASVMMLSGKEMLS